MGTRVNASELLPKSDIPLLTELERLATTREQWHSQLSEPVEITDIQIRETEMGLEIVLVTAAETVPLPPTEILGNSLIVEIPNAVLKLPEGEELLVSEPIEGIALVNATNLPDNRVQVTITGIDAPPIANSISSAEGWALRVTPESQKPREEIEVVVTQTQAGERYLIPNATTGTRTDTPVRDVPQSIQVIPRRAIEDQQAIRLNDVVRNVSGVVASSNDPRGQRFTIRGFDSSSVLRDGFRLTNGGNGNIGFPELANIEQIEVLKGPAAILFGSLEPGGVINLVSKQPLSEPFYELGFRVGNRGLVEPSIDMSGPLTEDGRVLYRLNALYRIEESFRDFDTKIERFFLAPVVSVKISDRADLTFDLEYRDDERPADFGLVALGREVANIPLDRILGEPDDVFVGKFLRAGYQFEHRFSDNWKIRNAFHYTRYESEFISASGFGRLDETTGTLARTWIFLSQPNNTFEVQTNVVGDFSTGSIDHTLLAGVDFYRREDVGGIGRGNARAFNFINIFNPTYGATPRPDFNQVPIFFDGDTIVDAWGIYLQDQISLLDNLKLLAGFRYDTVEQRNTNRPSFFRRTASETTRNDNAFSPRVGLVYQPIEEISLFASYSRSFAPNFGSTVAGDILEPEQGQQFEVGARAELLGGQLVASLAFFDITKENVATPDPNFPTFSVATGEQRSQGIEFDLIGEIVPRWNLIANYAYTDARITSDNSGLEGNRLFSVPEHNFNLWTNYEIQEGSLQGLGFGFGVNYVGQRFGDNANSFELDSYFLSNAAISYRRDNWKAALNIRNLFDVDYIESSENNRRAEINPGEGLTIIGSFSIEF
ncbi:TonB-dependent receptor [Lusitaniella coriacea LEGE 07157]|uniref:TonB-dependent receptor n=2 Tax=Lusitaniella TaxID=1983104 RepID=A0A8J7DY14_9CYAN|nr:TonB-dependent receptor [Lusitaniella coriacea LEGE 07157]